MRHRTKARPLRHGIVDEPQDFGLRELHLVAALAAPGPRALLFAADIGQRMHRWPFPLDFDRR